MKFSIIVPVYNVEDYVEEALESISQQTYKNYEVIIINDGSTDKSLDICNMYKQKHENVRIINQKNGGLSEARNTGIHDAQGDFIYFFDSDDYMHPNLLEMVNNKLDENPMLDLIQFQYKSFKNGKLQEDSQSKSTVKKDEVLTNEELLCNLCDGKTTVFTAWSYVIRTSIIQKNNLEFLPKIVHEDVPFIYSLFKYVRNYICLSDVLYYYRSRQNSITKSFNRDARAYSMLLIINSFYGMWYHSDSGTMYSKFIKCKLKDELNRYLLEAFSVREAMFVYRRYGGKKNLSLPKVLWKRNKFLMTFHVKNIVKRILNLFHLY